MSVWKMQYIANLAEYSDAPEYNNMIPPRGGYVVYCEKGYWSEIGFCDCCLRLGKAQAYLAKLQTAQLTESEYVIHQITLLDTLV